MIEAVKSIHELAADCDADGVRSQLANGVLVDARDEQDYTPLAYAVMNPEASVELLSLLLEKGANVDAAIENGKTHPLSLAACSGNLKSLTFLLNAGASVNATTPKGYTALINSVYRLHKSESLLPVIDLLIERGADVNCETDYGERPITVASRLGRFDVVRTLIDAGADPSPLNWSDVATAVAIGEDADLARVLSSKGLESKADCFGRGPGILAAIVGSVNKGKLLVSHGWKVNEQGRHQESALMCSASANHAEMTAWLIANGAELDAVDDSKNSPLLLASQAGSGECVRLLLEANANVRLANEYGDTAMSSAATVEVVRQLQKAGESIGQISTEMKRELTGLSRFASVDCSLEEYQSGKRPKPGNGNPQVMDIPFWSAMVRAGCSAYQARALFNGTHELNEPVWCYSRFGCSFTELPDGRFVQIGGEHEDHYDPDFCIYNDVIVHSALGNFVIYGYPFEAFRPTDFHSATYADGYIYIVGCLGYHGTRIFGSTPVYRLSCDDWSMTEVATSGTNPGWVYKHNARLLDSRNLVISGGTVATIEEGEEQHKELIGEYVLCLATMTWNRRD